MKNQGSCPGKKPILSKKEKFALYLTPEKKAVLERRYREDGSRSLTAFIERAVDFYLDYLSANNAGLFLPASIKSYVDGQLGQLENRMSSLLYKQAVEQDMVAGILADVYQFSEDDLRRRRAESISNVKKTNGRISLDQRVRKAWEEGMSGRTDRQEFLLQVRRERHPQRLPALHRHPAPCGAAGLRQRQGVAGSPPGSPQRHRRGDQHPAQRFPVVRRLPR